MAKQATTVAIVGMGYVGLPTALAFHDAGVAVIGLDVSPQRLEAIRAGDVDLLPEDHLRLGVALADPDRFRLSGDPALLAEADAVLICVPTPVDRHHVPQLGPLQAACQQAVAHARAGQVLVLTSTSYPGTTSSLLVQPLAARGLHAGQQVHVAFAPERIDPANSRFPQERVPRVIGGATAACTEAASRLLATITRRIHPVGSPEAAEMVKLLENTFRAVNISLANEFADACGQLGLDPAEVVDAAATKPYGFMAFRPGPGVGGHCIPVDPHYLLWHAHAGGVRLPVVEAAMAGIATRPARVVQQVMERLSADGLGLAGARVLLVGVAYKPGVEDVREAPALEIWRDLAARGARVRYYDPFVRQLTVDGAQQQTEPLLDPAGHDLVVVCTRHPEVDYAALAGAPRLLDYTYQPAAGQPARTMLVA
ncbi:MAG TPA: nucleotide sugar dehydrogenase [Actinomycetes bacterium]|jgi:nucleotide sugar dehydrogenase|nr:nucleotide sugar dehydrogenase [Actinomycetes bacterium]